MSVSVSVSVSVSAPHILCGRRYVDPVGVEAVRRVAHLFAERYSAQHMIRSEATTLSTQARVDDPRHQIAVCIWGNDFVLD